MDFTIQRSKESIQLELKLIKASRIKKLTQLSVMAKYRMNPALWLVERLGEDVKNVRWSDHELYKNHNWDGDVNPLLAAWDSLAALRNTGLMSGTSTGKTYWLARVTLWYLDCFENPLIVTTAPKESQLKLHMWSEISRIWDKFKGIRPYATSSSLRLKKDMQHIEYFDSAVAVGFVAGVGASEESATKAQGFHRPNMLIIIEECPGVHDAIIKAFENTSTGTNNMILAVGNPDNMTDSLSTFCNKESVNSFRISGYDHPNIVCREEIIPGAVSLSSILTRKREYGVDSPFFKSRVRGISPTDSIDSLVKLSWCLECADLDLEIEKAHLFNGIGVDVANSEAGDKAAVAYGLDNVLDGLYEFQCPNANHLAYNIMYDGAKLEELNYQNFHIPTANDYNVFDYNIGIDGVGVGAATVNTFLDLGYNVISLVGGPKIDFIPLDDQKKPMWIFGTFRDQLFWTLREDIRNKRVYFRISKEQATLLFKELVAHKYTVKGGKIKVTPKDDVKSQLGGKSPNLADAVAYWNWMRKGYHASGHSLPIAGG